MIRVLIIAPTLALRAGLRALLVADDLEVSGEAATAAGASVRRVDVVLLAGGAELPADAVPAEVELTALVLSDDVRSVEMVSALPLTGWGVVGADADAAEIQAAVRAVAAGLTVLGAGLAARVLMRRSPALTLDASERIDPLTPREQEVLNLIAQGLPNKQIARTLAISEHTVKFHIAAVFTKLGAASRTEAIRNGARQGLITL